MATHDASSERHLAAHTGDTPAAVAARILARQAPAQRAATAVAEEVFEAERRRGQLIRAVAELPALSPPDPQDRYTRAR